MNISRELLNGGYIEVNCGGEEWVDFRKLKEFQGDLKERTPERIAKLKRDILEEGFDAPFFVWKGKNFILDGHGRKEVLLDIEENGPKRVPDKLPVVWIEAKTEAEAKKKVLKYASQYGVVTESGYEAFMADLPADLLETLPMTIDIPHLDLDLNETNKTAETTDVSQLTDRADELNNKWRVRQGHTWQLNRHKLICGDSSEIMEKVDGVCTDPPYDLLGHEVIRSIEGFADVAVVLCADKLAFDLTRFWDFRLDFIWRHRTPRKFPSTKIPLMYHNHILVLAKSKHVKTEWSKPSPDFGSVLELESEYTSKEFGQGKSEKLFENMLAGFDWETVADPFCGTGGTIIACEKQGRICVAVEKQPKIAAVALERWVAYSGVQPEIVAT